MLNEREVTAELEQRGFLVIAPEQMEADAIASMLRDAHVVVGVEESALIHAAVTADRGDCIVAIQSPTAFDSFYRRVTSAVGQHFAFSVGDPVQGESFIMPVERLLRSIALVEAELS